jgi:hypothetical protein
MNGVSIYQVSIWSPDVSRRQSLLSARGQIETRATWVRLNTGHFLCPPLRIMKPIPVCSMGIGLQYMQYCRWFPVPLQRYAPWYVALKLTFAEVHICHVVSKKWQLKPRAVNTTAAEKFLNSRIVVLYVGRVLEMHTVILGSGKVSCSSSCLTPICTSSWECRLVNAISGL